MFRGLNFICRYDKEEVVSYVMMIRWILIPWCGTGDVHQRERTACF